jgi:NAD(P)-dependent dehydrogenase (short-subunit alcohol dehydrogenase family)
MKRLSNKIALITGGSSGIGLATALQMAEQGATVYIVGRDKDKLALAFALTNLRTISADASTLEGIDIIVNTLLREEGRIDILFANAGVSECPPFQETTEADYDHVMNINVKGLFFLFAKAFPLLSEGASVIFTSSVANSKGRPGDPLYSASKAAVRSLGRTLALDEEVLAKKVRVNVVSPGVVRTPLTAQHTTEMQAAIDAYVEQNVPMQRWGQAEEIANAVMFLASDDAAYMTGSEMTIDGGLAQI